LQSLLLREQTSKQWKYPPSIRKFKIFGISNQIFFKVSVLEKKKSFNVGCPEFGRDLSLSSGLTFQGAVKVLKS